LNEPTNLAEWLLYVRTYENSIYVRHQDAGGKWINAKLSAIPLKDWSEHVARWLKDGILPVRILSDEEVEENQKNYKKKYKPDVYHDAGHRARICDNRRKSA
jgi:hypothetical protein